MNEPIIKHKPLCFPIKQLIFARFFLEKGWSEPAATYKIGGKIYTAYFLSKIGMEKYKSSYQ